MTLIKLNVSKYSKHLYSHVRLVAGVFLLVGLLLASGANLRAETSIPVSKSPQKTMRVLANHLPPYMFINHDSNDKIYSGFEHDLATSLANELGFSLQYVECPWQECLRLLKTGQIDIAHNLLRSGSRETFLEFVFPSYLKGVYTTVFYQRFNDSRIIDDFEDLLADGFVVGYVGSTVYFPELENTERLLKMDVKNRETGLRLLASGKIDVLAGFDELFDGIELKKPNIKKVMKKTQFRADAELESFSAISRASDLFDEREKISAALQRLKESGEMEQWKNKWLKNLPRSPVNTAATANKK